MACSPLSIQFTTGNGIGIHAGKTMKKHSAMSTNNSTPERKDEIIKLLVEALEIADVLAEAYGPYVGGDVNQDALRAYLHLRGKMIGCA